MNEKNELDDPGDMPFDPVIEHAKRKRIKPPVDGIDLQDNPKTRVSIFGRKFNESKDTSWFNYPGAGWVHQSELEVFKEEYAKCKIRLTWHNKEVMKPVLEGWVCQEEVKNGWMFCKYSEVWHKKDRFLTVKDSDGKPIIASSYWVENACGRCDVTKEAYPLDSLLKVYGSNDIGYVWKGAAKGVIKKCPKCERWYEKDNIRVRRNGNELCNGCWKAIRSTGSIHSHDFHVYPKSILSRLTRLGAVIREDKQVYATNTPVLTTGARLYGVEVETEMVRSKLCALGLDRYDVATIVLGAIGKDFALVKEDGTLTMNGKYSGGEPGASYAGFEVVSAPADISTHRKRWPKLLDCEGYSLLRAWDTETCGFHVHVDKNSLTTLQVGRILRFINHPNNHNFVQKVAGRSEKRFTKYLDKNLTDSLHPERVINPEENKDHDRRRRVAVNTCNQNTIEFRIFRGTINPNHIIRNIEFCDAVCDFCHPASRSFKDLEDYTEFVKFVDSDRKRWPKLAEWLAFHQMGVKISGVVVSVEKERIMRGGKRVLIKKFNKTSTPPPDEHEIKTDDVMMAPKVQEEEEVMERVALDERF
jgi:hypothetical protein